MHRSMSLLDFAAIYSDSDDEENNIKDVEEIKKSTPNELNCSTISDSKFTVTTNLNEIPKIQFKFIHLLQEIPQSEISKATSLNLKDYFDAKNYDNFDLIEVFK